MANKEGYSKGRVIHRTKKSAQKLAEEGRLIDVPCRVVPVHGGWRVDKKW